MSKLRWLFAMIVAIALVPTTLPAKQGAGGVATITGRVTSEAGAPLGGSAVFIQALNVGTITRQDGTYILSIPPGRVTTGQQVTVTAQMIGYRSANRQVPISATGPTQLDFTLATDVLQLEGVVATGIGRTVTRDRLGVSIASVGGEELTRVQTPNVVTALAGKAPNVEITQNAGDPGASSYIRIRGVNTIVGTGEPLFVVDGVPIDNSENHLPASTRGGLNARLGNTAVPNRAMDINPADIASIEILKGAAAAAVYGARAANGVVLITTRSGQPGVTRASLHTTITHDQVVGSYPQQHRYGHGSFVADSGRAVAGVGLRAWGPELAPGTPTYDHFGMLFQNGGQVDATLSLSGATDRTTYYLSMGRLNHEGVAWGGNDWFNRSTARLRGSHRLLDNLNVTGNFAYSETEGSFLQRGSNVNGLLLGGLRTPPEFNNLPYLTPAGFHRTYIRPNPTNVFDVGNFANPFWSIQNNRTSSDVGRAWGNVGIEYAPMPWLNLSYTLGKDYSNDERLDVMPWGNTTRPDGWMAKGQFVTNNTDHNLIGTATHVLNEQVDGSLTLGYNRNSRAWRRHYTEGFTIVAPGIHLLDNTVDRIPNELQEFINAESFFGQGTVNLFGQLFLTAALRNDGFSTFAQSQPRHWYPKFSGAWEFTRYVDEALPFFNFGKLRGAWGQAGNEPPPYGTLPIFTAINIVDQGWTTEFTTVYAGRGGLRSGTVLEQPELRPERTSELEFGADLSFMNNRLGLGVTWYNAYTRDGIFYAPLAPSSGYQFQLQNVAEIENNGWEVTLDLRPFETPNVAFDLGLNWATNRNVVHSLGEGREFISMSNQMGGQGFTGASGVARVGYPVGVLQGNDFARCGQDTRQFVVDACAAAGNPIGAVYVDADGWPIDDPVERIIADGTPNWTAGVRGMLTLFRNIQISTVVDIMQGNQIWNGTKGAQYNYGMHTDTEIRGRRMTFAEYSGQQTVGPGAATEFELNQAFFMGIGGGFGPVGTQFVEDGSYVKLREIAVNYSIPSRFTRRVGMSGIDLRLAGRNLATWTNYTGLDPETNLSGNTNVRGLDYYNHPQTRSFILTVGVNR